MSHPHDPAPEYRDPGHTYPAKGWTQPQPPARRGPTPWWAWMLIGGGVICLALLADIVVGAALSS